MNLGLEEALQTPVAKVRAVDRSSDGGSKALSNKVDKLTKLVGIHDRNLGVLRAAILTESIKVPTESEWSSEPKKAKKAYTDKCLQMKANGSTQEQIELLMGKPHIHVWNALLTVAKAALVKDKDDPHNPQIKIKLGELNLYLGEYAKDSSIGKAWQRLADEIKICTVTELSHKAKGSTRLELCIVPGTPTHQVYINLIKPCLLRQNTHAFQKQFYGGPPRGPLLNSRRGT